MSPRGEMAAGKHLLRAERLTKSYVRPAKEGRAELELFKDLQFVLAPGELVAITGQSGAGKSSLLHLFAALDRPTSGEVWYGERRLSKMTDGEAARLRNQEIGFVWQFHYLLPEFTALENVALPLMAANVGKPQAFARARQWLGEVGLADRADHRSGELSGGEQQRISLARALITNPRVLLADEPTGDLDEGTAESVFLLLRRLHDTHGLASILVTHNQQFARRCDRVLQLQHGRLEAA